jgi:hypothetical protein
MVPDLVGLLGSYCPYTASRDGIREDHLVIAVAQASSQAISVDAVVYLCLRGTEYSIKAENHLLRNNS